jgi:4-amino-4-deoxy-L-arabinose transferase-like glycosyltransferase
VLDKNIRLNYLLIILIGSCLFFPFLGSVHLFDWDEINFAESAREMLVTDNYTQVQINYQPFWEKPPLFFWLQAFSMKLFGVNEFAARFPNAVCGIITLCFIFFIGKKYFSVTFGWLWVLAYIGSFLPHFYFKSGIIDPWFNLFIFSAIYFFINASPRYRISNNLKDTAPLSKWRGEGGEAYFFLSGIFTGLAVLTKGPVGLLIVLLTVAVWSLVKKDFSLFRFKGVLIFVFCVFLFSSLWYGLEIYKNGIWFLREFIVYQIRLFQTPDAGHGGPFYYHALVLLLGCFPASFFALKAFFKKYDADAQQQNLRLWMLILFSVVLVLFSIVNTKIIHYSSMCYLPLTFLAAYEMHFMLKRNETLSETFIAIITFFGMLIGLALLLLPYFGNHPEVLLPYINDSFAVANLMQPVMWQTNLYAFGAGYMALMLNIGFYFWQQQTQKGFMAMFSVTALIIFCCMVFFVPRIEQYSQGAAIAFYKEVKQDDAYVEVSGFKSYAHLFYTNKMPQENKNAYNKDWLLNGTTDKPVYIVTKIHKAEKFQQQHPQFQKFKETGGFVVFRKN